MTKPKHKQKASTDLNTRRINRFDRGILWTLKLQEWSIHKMAIGFGIMFLIALLFPIDHIVFQTMLNILWLILFLSFLALFLSLVIWVFRIFEMGIQWVERAGTEKRKRTPPKGIPTPETRSLTDDQTET